MADNVESIINSSIAGLEGADPIPDTGTIGDDSGSGDQSAELAAEGDGGDGGTADTTVQPAALTAEQDELAKELGLKPGQKDNRIPYSRVKQIVAKEREKRAAELTQLQQKLQGYAQYDTPDFQNAQQAWKVLDENPEQFLGALAQVDPRYAALLAREQRQEQRQAQQNVEPDAVMPDGSHAYTESTMQRIMDARAAEIERRIEQRFEQKFGPVVNDWQSAKLYQGAVSKAQTKLQTAEQWHGFNDAKADILKALQGDRSLSLEQAYINIVGPRLAANKDTMRAQVLAEMDKKPRAAAAGRVTPGGAGKPASSAAKTVEEIIMESIAGLE